MPAAAIAVQSEGGQLPTRPAPTTPQPTPTTDLVTLIRTVEPFPTRTPAPPDTPTPTVVPAYTSTPRPTATPMRGSFPQPPITFVPTRRPTSTPAPRGTFTGPGAPESKLAPTATPVDPYEPNNDAGHATALDVNPIQAYLQSPDDVDVYRVDVTITDVTLVVTLTGAEPGRYKLDLVGPRGTKVGRQRVDGTVAQRAFADVGSDTGAYYVYVSGAGPQMPPGPYFISADYSVLVSTPTRTPTG